ncbi:MAG: acetyl/propionyl/methylcrotonyl-CoA carboxylase subunit alpha [Kiloniellaceae bacterium]
MFEKILIANRGEIACRVVRTARRLGIRTVAVYSEADAAAAHVAAADEAYPIGPAPAAESYLKIEAVLAAAERSGAQAVHPGYGFLAENADFAEACAAQGLAFIGPPASAIRTLGSKSAAKALMEKADVPIVPGYHGEDQNPARLAEAAAAIGYPVLVKASAGGGGKGMRVVERAEDFAAALESARREAAAAFGDDRVLIEACLERPRHIEVQIFADRHGNVVHLFERDCSIQRRYQKVIEEAPAPGLAPERRAEMGAAAVTAARASGYVGAGTVEFIAGGKNFYFMEMNTRLQVEHPVTEMITGQDLVEWQIRVAAGEPLPLGQGDLALSGHAVEARIYAEDPARDFLPATGRLVHLRLPLEGPHVRADSGVREGDEIGVHYDPMIAKLIVWDRDRRAALARLRAALAETQIVGPATNVAFLAAVAAHPAYAAGEIDTGFIARHHADLVPEAAPASDDVLAVACLAELLRRRAQAEARARRSNDPYSPWHQTTGWRLNVETHTRLAFRDGDAEPAVTVYYRPDGYLLELPGGRMGARGEIGPDGTLLADLDGRRFPASVVRRGGELNVLLRGGIHRLHVVDPLEAVPEEEAGAGRVAAPMPGKVVKVYVAPGQAVVRGAPLVVLEAMKMEHSLFAPGDGTIAAVHCSAGDLVEEGAELIAFEAEGRAP